MDNRPAGLLGGGFGAFAPQNLYAGLLGDPNPQSLPEINVDAARQPGADAHDFVRQQLQSGEPQLPQRDVDAEMNAYKKISGYLPYSWAFKVFGASPDFKGGVEPGVAQELYNGDYKGALSDLFGAAVGYGASRTIWPIVRPIIWPKGGKKHPDDQKK